ncbi:hypothetical protein PSEUBRA_003863 [Kalmanozyma brasiliensis GHG001]|uniref:uncharacterized protein n=1 Tax=Kalmanozyma brasiliensis (strain GHG001) TaxID=1365824 RepID=UPI001CE804C1|nr:uncharacterized protein PSEUBRA_003863 [Kalmanozyma brasiliensis GHG001]KAF6767305.1 hypothetical protein PSEUBRA_003863 [Kalmanozyma brasiliensis GHG001]
MSDIGDHIKMNRRAAAQTAVDRLVRQPKKAATSSEAAASTNDAPNVDGLHITDPLDDGSDLTDDEEEQPAPLTQDTAGPSNRPAQPKKAARKRAAPSKKVAASRKTSAKKAKTWASSPDQRQATSSPSPGQQTTEDIVMDDVGSSRGRFQRSSTARALSEQTGQLIGANQMFLGNLTSPRTYGSIRLQAPDNSLNQPDSSSDLEEEYNELTGSGVTRSGGGRRTRESECPVKNVKEFPRAHRDDDNLSKQNPLPFSAINDRSKREHFPKDDCLEPGFVVMLPGFECKHCENKRACTFGNGLTAKGYLRIKDNGTVKSKCDWCSHAGDKCTLFEGNTTLKSEAKKVLEHIGRDMDCVTVGAGDDSAKFRELRPMIAKLNDALVDYGLQEPTPQDLERQERYKRKRR